MVQNINTTNKWEILKPEWNDLFVKCNNVTPFLSFAFQFSSWKYLVNEGTLHIITIIREKDDILQAIFPTYIDNHGILRFINGRHIDFCSALILPEFEHDYHLYEEFADYIKSNNHIKGFEFDNLKEDNYLSSILCYFFKGSLVTITNHWSCFKVGSPDTFETPLEAISHLNKKDRYQLKKMYNKTKDLDFTYYSSPKNAFPDKDFTFLVDYMTKNGMRTDAYFSDEFISLIKDCFNNGILDLGFSYIGNTPVSCNMCMNYKGEYVNWLALYQEGRQNTLNLLQTLNYMYEKGGGLFNFARGIYQYKMQNFRPEIHNLYKITYRKRPFHRFFSLFGTYVYYLKQVVKSIIRK